MGCTDKHRWDERYRTSQDAQPAACHALVEFSHLLPTKGAALDLACGLGGNALHLAQHGLDTSAWDISRVAIARLDEMAKQACLSVKTSVLDITQIPLWPQQFDVIVVSRYLHRPLCPDIARALSPGGLLFYQTFCRDKVDNDIGPSNPDYLLERNELLALFPSLAPLAYLEEGSTGDTTRGFRNEAYLIAQRF